MSTGETLPAVYHLSRYHIAKQNDGRGWMLCRLNALGSKQAVVVAVNLGESDARCRPAAYRREEQS